MSKSNVDTLEIQRLAYENAALKAELEAQNALLKEARAFIGEPTSYPDEERGYCVGLIARIDAALKGDSHE